ncbi:MAG: DUF885 family protein [Verrucomicrobiota bacterium]|nr:DUF885 family protein [Verrucomicrobiota bacterium]
MMPLIRWFGGMGFIGLLLFSNLAIFIPSTQAIERDSSLPPVRALIEAYRQDTAVLERWHPWQMSRGRHARMQLVLGQFTGALRSIPFETLGHEEQVDYLLFQNQLTFDARQLDQGRERHLEIEGWVPFGDRVLDLVEARQRVEPIDPEGAAGVVHQLALDVRAMQQSLDGQSENTSETLTPALAGRLGQWIDDYKAALRDWYGFYAGYHPSFTWWLKQPHEDLQAALDDYARHVRVEIAGYVEGEDPPVLGDPIGRKALMEALDYEMIAYDPEELIEIARAEFEWCDRQRKKAARELGFGDDWRAAYDFVKSKYVSPGEQPQLIKRLADEAIDFLETRDLLTIPPLAKEIWRMRMMSAERQKVNPYFTGGEVISVSFPTDAMEHADKLMSMRGNNAHFSKATVHHELIPGHHLQLFMAERHRTHRALFRTPFLVEGWALYWEMLLWDLDFHDSPEDRIGMLFWRSHRCARIIFSLSFHLGNMSAKESIDFLVDRVGHERRNATAEVRRSVQGGYIPLYQAAYMLGGLQIRSLHQELVASGSMEARKFHDTILRQNAIPIDMIRASLLETPLTPEYRTDWRFYHAEEPVNEEPRALTEPAPQEPNVLETLAIGKEFQGKITGDVVKPRWTKDGDSFWYRRHLGDGRMAFRWVDAVKGQARPAFDHVLVAGALSALVGNTIHPERLPIESLEMKAGGQRVFLRGKDAGWLWNPERGYLVKVALTAPSPSREDQETGSPRRNRDRKPRSSVPAESVSPDAQWKIGVREHNLWLTDVASGESFALSFDGNPGSSYQPNADRERLVGMQYGREDPEPGHPDVYWSPDSRWLVAMRYQPAVERQVHLIESSPRDQVQPKLHTYPYLKPGDAIPIRKPALFDLQQRREVSLDESLYQNPWSLTKLAWDPDSSRFTFLYNQRGHQVLRVVSVEAASGRVRALLDERSDTFVDYAYKSHYRLLHASREILWMSERDGWNHLYLFDADTGFMKHQVTRGTWVVRRVDRVDEERRQIWFQASGMDASQDPYYLHYCRVNFDGTGLVRLTRGNGTHDISFSPDQRFLLSRRSRVDMAPVTELRHAESGRLIMELERADMRLLEATGWQQPEPFAAKGRDGTTDIHGVIFRPTHFDPSKNYPVIEKIYAGPHGSFVPKSFRSFHGAQAMAELGFVVVQIDGMGTSNRSKAFHDVCWKNIGDAGFPDRIAWMKAAASTRPYMDLSRVGIYGGSAGGQNALRGLLVHGDFYKVGVADCGCHDNRMDKIWWNELWMGWPIGPHYGIQSNVTQAHRLQGKLLLLLGEMDRNVDPASTLQVVDALIRADRDFDMLMMPGVGHGSAGTPYGKKRQALFFMEHLLNTEPGS